MSYVYDEAAKTGTFFAVFARQGWTSSGCAGTSYVQNSLEAWDITDGAKPVLLDRLDFGKPNESVRGTAFDLSRKVLYAITYSADATLALLGQVSVDGAPAARLYDVKRLEGMLPSALVRDGSKLVIMAQPHSYTYSSTSSGTPSWEETSDRLMIFDLSANRLDTAYDQPTKAYALRIMGVQKDRAFLNLEGDGIVVVDVAEPTAPIAVALLRTLGYATHLESFGNDVYVASGSFGIAHLSLLDPPNL